MIMSASSTRKPHPLQRTAYGRTHPRAGKPRGNPILTVARFPRGLPLRNPFFGGVVASIIAARQRFVGREYPPDTLAILPDRVRNGLIMNVTSSRCGQNWWSGRGVSVGVRQIQRPACPACCAARISFTV
jgi:hypothetical protein